MFGVLLAKMKVRAQNSLKTVPRFTMTGRLPRGKSVSFAKIFQGCVSEMLSRIYARTAMMIFPFQGAILNYLRPKARMLMTPCTQLPTMILVGITNYGLAAGAGTSVTMPMKQRFLAS